MQVGALHMLHMLFCLCCMCAPELSLSLSRSLSLEVSWAAGQL